MTTVHNFIGGKWLGSGRTFTSIDPSLGVPIAEVSVAQEEEVASAVAAAREAFAHWANRGAQARAEILTRFAAILMEEYGQPGAATPLKQLITTEVGKRLPEADVEVVESADMVSFFANDGPRLLASEALRLNETLWPTKRSHVVYEPIGVVALIKPWNYPLELPIWSIAAALVAGNTIVFKPSEHSPLVSDYVARLLDKAGLPPGVLNVIHGGDDTGRLLVKNTGIDMLSFTGSIPAGKEIAMECARHLRKSPTNNYFQCVDFKVDPIL